jgi:hypothetical protein
MKLNPLSNRWLLISSPLFVLLFLVTNLQAGTPHYATGFVTYSGGGFPSSLTFSAYIVSRPGEVLTQASAGCAYYSASGQYAVQCGSFTTGWTAGDVLHISVNDGTGGTASGEVALTNGSYDELNIVIVAAAPTAPTIGTITQPTCADATGSVVLNGLPSSGTWTLTRYPDGSTSTGSGTSTTVTGLSAGTYYFTVTTTSGGESAHSADVVINAQPVIPSQPGTITGATSVCQGSSQTYSISAVSGATSYTWTLPSGWSGSSTSTSITATPGADGGTISVTASNACGTSIARTLSVSATALPLQPGTISGATSVCQGSSQTYSIEAVSGATSYTWTLPSGWSGTSTSTSITATPGADGGIISVTASNSCGTSTARTLSVSATALPSQPGTISGATSVCLGSSQTYSISAVSGATSYTWTLPAGWSGSSTSLSITATAGADGGTISVTANNSCGSGTARTLSVSVITTPAQPGTISGATSVCQGSSQTYSISAVSGATSYAWLLPSGWSGTSTSTSITATPGATGGTIYVAATNACGTSTARTLSVSVTAFPSQPGTISGATSVCQGSSQTYSISAVSGATSYTWTLPSGWSGSSTSTSITATPGADGGTISVTANNSCGSGTARTLGVTVTALPSQPGSISGATSVCQGSSPTYSISAVSGATSYTWTLPSGWSGSSTSTSITATAGATGGTISVIANNSCGSGTARTLSVSITTTSNQPGTITGATSVCQGSSQTYSISSVSGATSYTWTLPSGWSGSSASTSITATPGATGGTISVTANNSCGTSTARTLSVSVTTLPSQPGTITGATSVCQGSSQTYSIEAVSGATSYTWALPSGWSGSSTSTSITATAGATGGTISVTANNSCGSGTARTLSVTVTALPSQPGTITGATSVCQGSSQTYSISAVSGATSYTWALPAGWSGSSTSTSITAAAGATGGTISVTATNSCGTSTARTLSVSVTVLPSQPGIITGETSVCQGSSQTYSITAVSGATSYTWTLPAGWSGSSASTLITATTGAAGGTISVTANNSCGASTARTLSISVTAIPTVPAVGTITHPTCAAATGSVLLNNLPATGTWTLTRNPGGVTSTGTGTSVTISGLETGTYTFTVTNEPGCSSGSSGNVVINAQPSIPTAPSVGTITHPTCTLATGSVVLSGLPASGTWTLTRTPGGTTNTGTGTSATISGLEAGTYTFTVTNDPGCTSGASGNVVILANPGAPSAPVVGTITQPAVDVSTGSVVLSGLPSSGTWTLTRTPGGTTTAGTGTSITISELAAGTYTFTVTNESECTSGASGDVFINAVPVIAGQNTIAVAEDNSITITVADLVITDSDNTPEQMTVIVGSGTDYTVSGGNTITPAANFNGTLTVPIIVFDGIAYSATFNVSVSVIPVNDPPVIMHIPDQTIVQDSVFSPIYLDDFIEDIETPDDLITWTYEAKNIELLVTINDRVVSITVPEEGWTGSDTISFTATDDDLINPLSASDTIVFTVKKKSGTGVFDKESLRALVYPNPATDRVNILFAEQQAKEMDITIEILTIQGVVVFNSTNDIVKDNRIELDIHDLNSGTYFIRLITSDTVKTFKIAKKQ